MERGLEFYITLAAVAVGALTWLYKKGSRIWRTVRKLRRSFQEICLNPKSTLDDEYGRQLAIGAMYASQQGAWQNSLETGIFDTLPEILGRWWGIDSTAEPAGNWTTSAKRDSAITGPRCSKPSGSTTGSGRMRCSSSG